VPATTVYWRPGCVFCSSLLRGLDRAGLVYDQRNIWQDEDDAAFVRSVAAGNETVPTVVVGEVAMVNPTAREVLDAVARVAPDELPETSPESDEGALGRLVTRLRRG
jgi:glutaredoxin-like protein